MYSFAFIREPVSRSLSMFRFLQPYIIKYAHSLGLQQCSVSGLFDLFLEMLLLQKESVDNSKPFGLLFSTHVNPAWNDVVDNDDNIMLTSLFCLDHFQQGLKKVYFDCDLELFIPVLSTMIV